MNFQNLIIVETPQQILDVAFNGAKKRAEVVRNKRFKDKIGKSKTIEIERIETVKSIVKRRLDNIIESFPNFEALPDFYMELSKIAIDYENTRKSLGAVKWAGEKSSSICNKYVVMIKKTKDIKKINQLRREYYGRVSSIIKQIKNNLFLLEETRKKMKSFPTVKTSTPTVSLFGFPNIGKTTLLFKLTGSKPEIKEYAFTTKKINVAYISRKNKKIIQVLDTPGTLNRIDKMNNLEKQAYLALKHCSDLIIYVIDLTTETYPIEKQMKLLKRTTGLKIPVIIYLSKSDLLEDKEHLEFIKNYPKYKIFFDSKELSKEIIKKLEDDLKDDLKDDLEE